MWAHKEGSQPEHKAIEHSEIRRTLSGAIADQELMFEQERFSCDLARAARAEEFREGHEQMDRQEEQIAHELKIIMPANLRKTAPQRRFMPKLPIRHPQVSHQKQLDRNATNADEIEQKLRKINETDRYAAAHNGLVAGLRPALPPVKSAGC
jgi:hypothetical protein